ncbi:MAG: hypothetical protein NUV67_05805 [archaeon]|nr:hypothetical protein [archaeon]
MESIKGLIFTYDAIIGIMLIITIFGASAVLISDADAGETGSALATSAYDIAIEQYYSHTYPNDQDPLPSADNAACSAILEYNNAGATITKVRKCTQLE